MKTTLCTLFNSLYLDKGLVLYDSLTDNAKDFELYVLCMDDKCYEVLERENYSNLIPIKLSDFENTDLLNIKKERKFGEYFWTCSSWLISYVLDTYKPAYCTYIDADMYFYSDPAVIIEEMMHKNASVQVVGHLYNKLIDEHNTNILGKYCVEFNTFKNDSKGRSLLDIWKNQVLEKCSADGDGVNFGDQKYLDNWTTDYDFVIETKNVGAGLGPWNVCNYLFARDDNGTLEVKRWNRTAKLIFYHFENIQYIDKNTIKTNFYYTWLFDKKFIKLLYKPYLREIRIKKEFLSNKYGINTLLKAHPGFKQKKQGPTGIKNLINIIKGLFTPTSILHKIKVSLFVLLPMRFYRKYSVIKF